MKIRGEFPVKSPTPVLSLCIFLSLCILQNALGYHLKPGGASLEGGPPRDSGGDHAAELKRARATSVPAGQPGASLVESSTNIPILTFDMMSDDDKKLARTGDVDWLCRTTTEDGGCNSREQVIGGELVVKGVCPPGYCCSRVECKAFGCGDVCVKTTHKSCKYSALHNAKYSDGNCSCTSSKNFKCSPHAECLEFPSTPEFAGGVKCRCRAGYVGDGINCRLPSDPSTPAEPRGGRVGIRAGGNLGGRGTLTGGINGSFGLNLGGGGPIGLTVGGGSSGSYSHGSTGGTGGVTVDFGAGAGRGGHTPAGGDTGGAGTGSGAGSRSFGFHLSGGGGASGGFGGGGSGGYTGGAGTGSGTGSGSFGGHLSGSGSISGGFSAGSSSTGSYGGTGAGGSEEPQPPLPATPEHPPAAGEGGNFNAGGTSSGKHGFTIGGTLNLNGNGLFGLPGAGGGRHQPPSGPVPPPTPTIVPPRGQNVPAPRVYPPSPTPPAPTRTPQAPPAPVVPTPTVHPPSDVSGPSDVPSPPETGGGGKGLIGGLGKVVSALTSGGGVSISGGIGGSISTTGNGSVGGHLSPHLSVTANGGAGVSGGLHGGSSHDDASKGSPLPSGIHIRIPTRVKLPRFGFSASVGGDAGIEASKWTQNTGGGGYDPSTEASKWTQNTGGEGDEPSTEASKWTQNTGGKGYDPRTGANADEGLEEGADGGPEAPGGEKRPTGILTHAYDGALPVPSASEAGAPACEGSPCGAGECIPLSATTYRCVCPQDYLLVEHPGAAYCVHLNYGQSISLTRQ